jgi:DNA-directed RNA polymerase beta' subunit
MSSYFPHNQMLSYKPKGKEPVTPAEKIYYGRANMKTAELRTAIHLSIKSVHALRCFAEALTGVAAKNIKQIMKGKAMKKRVLAAVMAAGMCLLFSRAAPAQNRDDSSGLSMI